MNHYRLIEALLCILLTKLSLSESSTHNNHASPDYSHHTEDYKQKMVSLLEDIFGNEDNSRKVISHNEFIERRFKEHGLQKGILAKLYKQWKGDKRPNKGGPYVVFQDYITTHMDKGKDSKKLLEYFKYTGDYPDLDLEVAEGWSHWGHCTKSCGGGVKKRSCTKPDPSKHGTQCRGNSIEECNKDIECDTKMNDDYEDIELSFEHHNDGSKEKTDTNKEDHYTDDYEDVPILFENGNSDMKKEKGNKKIRKNKSSVMKKENGKQSSQINKRSYKSSKIVKKKIKSDKFTKNKSAKTKKKNNKNKMSVKENYFQEYEVTFDPTKNKKKLDYVVNFTHTKRNKVRNNDYLANGNDLRIYNTEKNNSDEESSINKKEREPKFQEYQVEMNDKPEKKKIDYKVKLKSPDVNSYEYV